MIRKRVLSGIQPTGSLHLGNYAGAVRQFIELQETHEMYIFVASYHAMTSVHDPQVLAENIRQVVMNYIAFGLDPDKCYIYVQHDVPAVTELAWMLGCVCPKSQMDKATSYKDKTAKGISPSIGLYTYPVLQAADILVVNPDVVPVGEDQRQHVEITRDLAQRFNHRYGTVFKAPDLMVRAGSGVLPGVDGQKMSKSYDNTIDPFMPEKKLRKRVMKIVSDSKAVEDAKDPEDDTTFQVFRAIAGDDDPRTVKLAERYRASGEGTSGGGMGYGEAKQQLFELLMDHFGPARQRREQLLKNPGRIDEVLRDGASAANELAGNTLRRVRQAVGLAGVMV